MQQHNIAGHYIAATHRFMHRYSYDLIRIYRYTCSIVHVHTSMRIDTPPHTNTTMDTNTLTHVTSRWIAIRVHEHTYFNCIRICFCRTHTYVHGHSDRATQMHVAIHRHTYDIQCLHRAYSHQYIYRQKYIQGPAFYMHILLRIRRCRQIHTPMYNYDLHRERTHKHKLSRHTCIRLHTQSYAYKIIYTQNPLVHMSPISLQNPGPGWGVVTGDQANLIDENSATQLSALSSDVQKACLAQV